MVRGPYLEPAPWRSGPKLPSGGPPGNKRDPVSGLAADAAEPKLLLFFWTSPPAGIDPGLAGGPTACWGEILAG